MGRSAKKTVTTITSSGKFTTAGGSTVKKKDTSPSQGQSSQPKQTQPRSIGGNSDRSDWDKSLSWANKENSRRNRESSKTEKPGRASSNKSSKENQGRKPTFFGSNKRKETTVAPAKESLPKFVFSKEKTNSYVNPNSDMIDNNNFMDTVQRNKSIRVVSPNLNIKTAKNIDSDISPNMSLEQKFEIYRSDPTSGTHMTLAKNQNGLKKGYVRVYDAHGNETTVKEANIDAAVTRVAKQQAWKTKGKLYGDKFATDNTPTAYLDEYGISHVAPATTAWQIQDYKDSLNKLLGGNQVYSTRGNNTESSGINSNYDMREWLGYESGGYARDDKGNRLNISGLKGAVPFDNRVDSNGNAIDEAWSDEALLGDSVTPFKNTPTFIYSPDASPAISWAPDIDNSYIASDGSMADFDYTPAVNGVVGRQYSGDGSEIINVTLDDGTQTYAYKAPTGEVTLGDGSNPPMNSIIHTNTGDYVVGADGSVVSTGKYTVTNGKSYDIGTVSVTLDNGDVLTGQKVWIELPDGTGEDAIVDSTNHTYLMNGDRPPNGTVVYTKTGTYIVSEPTETGSVDENRTQEQSYTDDDGFQTYDEWADDNDVNTDDFEYDSYDEPTSKDHIDFDADIDYNYEPEDDSRYEADMEKLTELINRPVISSDYKEVFNQLYSQVKAQYPDLNIDRMTWQEACDQASEALKPQFDLQMKKAMESTAASLAANGFYGQGAGSVLQGEMALSVEAARQGAINDMAMNFMQQDEARAEYLEQMNLERQNQMYTILQNAVDMVTNQRNADISALFNLAQLDLQKENQAYERWWNQLQAKREDYWNTMEYNQTQDQLDYQKYIDEKNFQYQKYLNDKSFNYNKYLDYLKAKQQEVDNAQQWETIAIEIGKLTGAYNGMPTFDYYQEMNDVTDDEIDNALAQANYELAVARLTETMTQNDFNNQAKVAALRSNITEKARKDAMTWLYAHRAEWWDGTNWRKDKVNSANRVINSFISRYLDEAGL